MKLPEKHDRRWLIIISAIFILTFATMTIRMLAFESGVTSRSIIGFLLFSIVVAILSGSGGYFGFRIHFILTSIFNIIGLIFMYGISMTRASEGWSDLTGFATYIFLLAAGLLAGSLTEVIFMIIRNTGKGK